MKTAKNTGVTRDHVRWAYRLFLDREPESEQVLERCVASTAQLRREFLASNEFQAKNPDLSLSIDKWVIVPTALGFRIFVALNEFGVSRPILLDQYEIDAVKLFQTLVKRGDRVMDIGANIGFHSLLLSTLVGPTGAVLAFEPVPYLYRALVSSIAENGFQETCRAYDCAVADRPGRGKIRYAMRTINFGGGHLAQTQINDDDGHSYQEVEIKTLDEFAGEKRYSFIKIDVEGAEVKVLRGATDLLRRDRPMVFAELFNEQLRIVSDSNATELIQFMGRHGYRCFGIDAGKPGAEVKAYDRPEITNVIFLP